MRKRFLGLGLAVVMTMSLTACGGSNTAETTEATEAIATDAEAEGSEAVDTAAASVGAAGGMFKINGIGPVADGTTVYGVAVQHSAKLAVKEINEAGGINGAQIEFNFQDDEHDAKKSVNAYNTLKNWGMQVLTGAVTPAPCVVVADKTAANNMFQIALSDSAVECAANPNVFRICSSDPDQGAAFAKYIDENKLASEAAVIYDSSGVYSSGIYEKFVEGSANQGIETVAIEAFTADSDEDFSTQLQKTRDADAELVFLPIYYIEASLILQQAGTMDFTPQFFGCGGMDGIPQVQNFNTKLVGELMLLTPFAAGVADDLTVKFVESYKAAYNEVPVQFITDAHDAIYAVKTAIEDVNVAPDIDASTIYDALKASMLNIKLDGLTDKSMTWTEDDEPHKAPKAVRAMDGTYSAI